MLGGCPCCPFLTRRCSAAAADDPTADRDPVLLIPGIGGSILSSRKKKSGSDTRVWVRIWLADLEFKKKLWSLYNPDTEIGVAENPLVPEQVLLRLLSKLGYTEELDKNYEIVVPDDDFGLYAINILDPSLFVRLLHVSEVFHFHDMIEMLVDCGYKKGTTLFGYGYDFRQSNRIDKSVDGLRVKLETAHKASGGRKVNIISHSMGGLLVKCFLSLYPDIFAKYVNNWICLGSPFQGAPGCINDALLTGLQFVEGFPSYFFVSRWTMHQLLVECPSIYEMLPNPGFKWNEEPKIQVWCKQSEKEEDSSVELKSYGPIECSSLFDEALKDNELSIDGEKIALPFNRAIYEWATETRRVLNAAQLPEGVSFYNVYGTSFDTPFNVCYGSEDSPIVDLSEICDRLPEYSSVDGDETVPAESAKADGLAATERVAVSARHRELLCDKRVFELIQKWLGVSPNSTKLKKASKVMDATPS